MKVLSIFLFTLSTQFAFSQYAVVGPLSVCPTEMVSYSVSGTPTPISYQWSITGGHVISAANGIANVCWTNSGPGTISVILLDAAGLQIGNPALSVTVNPQPQPVLLTDFTSDCVTYEERDGVMVPVVNQDSCWHVCQNSTVHYSVSTVNPTSTYTWNVTGSMGFTSTGPGEIEVYWGIAGVGSVTVTETSASGCTTSVTRCVKIIESPWAIITAYPGGADCRHGGSINVCLDQEALFFGSAVTGSSNSPIVSYLWDFGAPGMAGNISTHQNVTHSWSTPGIYYVTLTVTNACNCSGSCTIEVIVDSLSGVNIECPAPVCENDTASYYTDAVPCTAYNWTVVNGTIISSPPYGSSIQVKWNSGGNGNGILCLDNTAGGCPQYCPGITCVEIPIVSSTSAIAGPTVACIGSQHAYSVPSMDGSIYTWSIVGVGGTILEGQGTNEILVEWTTPGVAFLHVNYINAFLDCGGSGDLTIEIKEGFSISGPGQGCPGANLVFSAVNPSNIVFDWTATDPLGQVYTLGSSTGVPDFTVTWTYPSGTFVITASHNSNSYCNPSASFLIEINDAPPPPALPLGDDMVCPISSHIYTALPTNGNYFLEWTVTGGSPASATGNEVTITWGASPPYQISLIQTDALTGCVSNPAVKPIDERVYVAPDINGTMDPCINSTETYNITNVGSGVADYKYDQLEWVILDEERGSVSSGQGATTPSVQWNNLASPPGTYDTYLQVVTTLCSIEHKFPDDAIVPPNITLQDSPPVTISPQNATVCEGDLVPFTVNAPGTMSWDFGDGSNSPNPHAYQLPAGASVTTFQVTVTVTNGGCVSYASTMIHVEPAPEVAIMANPGQVCPPGTIVTLSAVLQTGSFTYNWSTGASTTSITTSTPGTYTVTITNSANGCSASNLIILDGCQPPTCLPDPSVTVGFSSVINYPSCNEVLFNGNINPPTTNYLWEFGNGHTNSSNLTPTQSYATAGNYYVCLTAFTPPNYCTEYCQNVMVPMVANFSVEYHCSSTPGSYEVQLTDQSTYIQNPISSWTWYEGGNQIATGTGPVTTTLSYGPHDITLAISNGTPSEDCEVTLTIQVPKPPEATFTVVGAPFCEEQTVVHFAATSNANVHHALWDFNDGATYAPPYPQTTIDADRVYENDGDYDIVLTVTDFFGCVYTSPPVTVTINNNGLAGVVDPYNLSFCPGGSNNFSYAPDLNSSSPTGWLWSTGATTPVLTVTQSGTYFVTVSDNYGCSYTPQPPGNAAAANVPQPIIRGDLALCEGEDVSLNGSQGLNPSLSYSWTVTPPISFNNPEPWLFEITGPGAGTYTVQLMITSGVCSLSATVDVVVNPAPPPPDIQSSVTNPCEGQPIDLTVTNAGGYWVNWSNGATGPMITVYNANLYQATMTDANGCTNSGTITVHENPYAGFMPTGCFEFCDTISIVIPGSAPLEYDKWEWWINGQMGPYSTGTTASPVAPLTLGMLPAGVYVVTLHLVISYPDGTDCDWWTDPMEITVKTCPCPLDPNGRIYCMKFSEDSTNVVHQYHFEIWPDYQCSGNPNVTVTSPDGGTTLFSWSTPPGYLSGILSTALTYPQTVCFNLDFIDPSHPECNCNYKYCMKLPKCPYPKPCDIPMWITNVVCTGYDPNGYPVYTFSLTVAPTNLMYSNFSASNGWLTGMPFLIGPGTTVINGTFTDATPADGFCVILEAYDFDTHQMCRQSICVDNPPGCNTRLAGSPPGHESPVAKPVTITPQLYLIPNPSKETVQLQYLLNSSGEIKISNTRGQPMLRYVVDHTRGTIDINTMAWEPGIYFVTISSQSGDRLIRKMVVLK